MLPKGSDKEIGKVECGHYRFSNGSNEIVGDSSTAAYMWERERIKLAE